MDGRIEPIEASERQALLRDIRAVCAPGLARLRAELAAEARGETERATEGIITMPRRYTTEIRGDGTTRTWTLPHSLHDPAPTVAVCDAAHRTLPLTSRCAWPSAHEVAITFALAPPVGTIYQVEFVAS